MVLAKKELTVEEYTAFAEEYHEARLVKVYKCGTCQWVIPDGPLAQSVERRADNAKVVSSRLTWTTKTFFFQVGINFFFFTSSSFMFAAFSKRTEIKRWIKYVVIMKDRIKSLHIHESFW